MKALQGVSPEDFAYYPPTPLDRESEHPISPPSSFLLPLHLSYLVGVTPNYITPFLAFNYAVWRYRKPAQASRTHQSRDWLVNRIVELSLFHHNSFSLPKRKKPKIKPLSDEPAIHDDIVASAGQDTVLMYTDGSASPNPGPCGAGVVGFLQNPDTIIDMGESLGHGTNNLAELYALGIALTESAHIKRRCPLISVAHIFSDSKLALNAAVSSRPPLTNGPITRAVRNSLAFVTSLGLVVSLHWVRGHSAINGNERVDQVSKRYASASGNTGTKPFSETFTYTNTSVAWPHGYPLTGLPLKVFLANLPAPPARLEAPCRRSARPARVQTLFAAAAGVRDPLRRSARISARGSSSV